MARIEDYPHWGTQEEKDLFLQRWVTQYNLSQTASTSTGTVTNALQVNDNNEIIESGTERRTGWFRRYLHIRITSDAGGQTLVNPSGTNVYTGQPLYVSVYNTDESNPSNLPNDANFILSNTFSNWTSSMELFYTIFGDNIRFEIAADTPAGRTQVTASTDVIDLQAGAGVGATGQPGEDGTGALRVVINYNQFEEFGTTTYNATITHIFLGETDITSQIEAARICWLLAEDNGVISTVAGGRNFMSDGNPIRTGFTVAFSTADLFIANSNVSRQFEPSIDISQVI